MAHRPCSSASVPPPCRLNWPSSLLTSTRPRLSSGANLPLPSQASSFQAPPSSTRCAGLKTAAVGVAKATSDVKASPLQGDSFNIALAEARFRLASQTEERAAQVTAVGSKADASSFSKAAPSALPAKPTYAAIGDVGSLSYADDLGL
ncbi:hypothetical protein FRC04_010305 [Tulasnella sp. 424]|nr:hypothetical protein FRC04_010305 [Tulasnella sp. 424]KAG8972687.1 hypothetical protein FRC05_009698 [Tulasnella sp. 425]